MNRPIIMFDREFLFFLTSMGQPGRICTINPRRASIKDIIESLGVPHTEVGTILVDNRETDFSCIPESSEEIVIKALIPPIDVTRKTLLRPHPFDSVKFVVDVNVGKLARLLLTLGFDTLYSNRFSDSEVAEISVLEQRIVLTRDTDLLKRKGITFAKRIRENDPCLQLREVLDFFGLARDDFDFFARCTTCNCRLKPVEKETILPRLEPKTKLFYTEFSICPVCSRIFWEGSHSMALKERLRKFGIFIDQNTRSE